MKPWLLVSILLLTLLQPVQPGPAATQPLRWVHAPYFASRIDWGTAAIFWFGRVDVANRVASIPGRNYADVRVAYTPSELQVFMSVIDYYLWHEYNPDVNSSPTSYDYDGAALYLDITGDRTGAPGTDDYVFLAKWGAGGEEYSRPYQRQARGNGSAWNTAWNGSWRHLPGAQWSCNPGPNSNDCGLDFGWAVTFRIPWQTLGLSGPPHGRTMGMGLQLFDRDAPDSSGVAPVQTWPETLNTTRPDTWGGLVLGPATMNIPLSRAEGTTTIRRGLPGSTVIDASVGADGNCNGGHEGNPDSPIKPGSNPPFTRGEDTSLWVASQSGIADFPCFARAYLRFNLDQIPRGKTIINARLIVTHWSQSGDINAPNPDDRPPPTLIQLFTVDPDWTETGVTWNNGPLARRNYGGVTVTPRNPREPLFPGVSYTWDATIVVAEAYAAGTPLNIALYTAAEPMHTSKYLHASEAGDFVAEARPTLIVTWGTPVEVRSRVFLPLMSR